MNKLKQWLIEEIETHLNDYEDTEIYACDVAYKIFESENANGSYTCSTYEAKEWIKQYWDDSASSLKNPEADTKTIALHLLTMYERILNNEMINVK